MRVSLAGSNQLPFGDALTYEGKEKDFQEEQAACREPT